MSQTNFFFSSERKEKSLKVGTYVLVKNGDMSKNHLPACIVQLNPLAVRYFVNSQGNLFSATDEEYDMLPEDILKVIKEPTHVSKGSRLYFTFDV
jgi:hypothetical protein